MASSLKLEQGTGTTLFTTGSAAVASGARSVLSADLDNTANLDDWAQFELVVTFATGPTAGKRINLYAIPELDGANYIDGSDSVAPAANTLVGWTFVRNVTTAQRLQFRGPNGARIPLTAKHVKYLCENLTDQQWSANWTLKAFGERYESV